MKVVEPKRYYFEIKNHHFQERKKIYYTAFNKNSYAEICMSLQHKLMRKGQEKEILLEINTSRKELQNRKNTKKCNIFGTYLFILM